MTEYKKKGEQYLDMSKFLSRAETLRGLLDVWHFSPGAESVPVQESYGRVSAEDVVSRNTLPVFRSSGPDGIAVRFADFAQSVPDTCHWKEGVDYAPSDCGDDFPDAFDTVIPIEQVSFTPEGNIALKLNTQLPHGGIKQGQLVSPRGSNIREGETVLKRGRRIGLMNVGLLVTAGISRVHVLKRPVVGYVPTGSELVQAGTVPKRGQNIESNGAMVAAFLASQEALPKRWPIVADVKGDLENALDESLSQCDMVLLNGGSSMGSEDFVSGLLARRASYHRHGILNVPGFPATVALIDGKPAINLPGPPFGAFCTLDWCVKVLLAHWYGQPVPQRRTVKAVLTDPIQKPTTIGMQGFEFCLRLRITQDLQGRLLAFPLSRETSNTTATLVANGLIIVPPDVAGYAAGDVIEAQWLHTDAWGAGPLV